MLRTRQTLGVNADSLIYLWKHFCNFNPVKPMKTIYSHMLYFEDVYMGDILCIVKQCAITGVYVWQ